MPDSDKELRIKITTAADASGLKQTLDALKEVSDAAKNGAPGDGENAPPDFPRSRAGDARAAGADPAGEIASESTLRLALNPVAAVARLLSAAAGAVNDQLSGLQAELAAARARSGGARDARSHDADPPTPPAEEISPGRGGNSAAPTSPPPDPAAGGGDIPQLAQRTNAGQTALLSSLAGLLQFNLGSTRELLGLIRAGQQDQARVRNEIAELRRSLANLQTSRQSGQPIPPP
jgi:hypothetical protein